VGGGLRGARFVERVGARVCRVRAWRVQGVCLSPPLLLTSPPSPAPHYIPTPRSPKPKPPGVKELFEKEAPKVVRRTRFQMHKAITPDYYGFRDEEDGVLLKVEAAAEQGMRAQVGCVDRLIVQVAAGAVGVAGRF
jgi:hypothetical protein